MPYKLSFKRKHKLVTNELMRVLKGKKSLELRSRPSNSQSPKSNETMRGRVNSLPYQGFILIRSCMGLKVSLYIGEKVVDEVHLERCMEQANPFEEESIEGVKGLSVCSRSSYLTHSFYASLWCSCMQDNYLIVRINL